jgi:hypothetical protein
MRKEDEAGHWKYLCEKLQDFTMDGTRSGSAQARDIQLLVGVIGLCIAS